MRGHQCLLNSRTALYRVFVSTAERPRIIRTLLPLNSQHVAAAVLPQVRNYQKSAKIYKERKAREFGLAEARSDNKDDDDDLGYDRRYTTKRSLLKSGRDRLPRDHEITDPKIMVLDNGTIEGPLETPFVMSKLLPEESLRMVKPFTPGNAKEEIPMEYALCSIVDKKAEYERERNMKERKKKVGAEKPKTKEIELSWSIGANDLATKAKQLAGFLEKGMKVEVVLGKKKGGKKVTDAEAEGVLRILKESVEEAGGRERKPHTGEVGGAVRMFVEKK